MDNFDFLGPNLAKNGFRIGNSEKSFGIRISIVEIPCVQIFRKKVATLTFSAQIFPKMDFGVAISKISVRI